MNGIILGGRYELLEKIGEGGMSEVYKAKCNKLNRFVAVKILKKQFADNKDIAQKFKREATAIANLSDANIVNILDVGTQDDIDYIVMELITGKTLKELINYSGKLTYNTAIKIALQIAKALDCAHRNNIIHRDIKPQNILVTENGEVKVTDFGIAKSTDSQTITNTTSIIGSAHYLSPEQAKGTYIDFRSDIYSFGIVLYEMVTGRLPFEGDSPVTVALKHLQEEPVPPKNINSAIPDSLNKLILKAVEKEPIKRYQNAKEMIQDLQKIQENPDVVIGSAINTNNDSTIIMAPISNVKANKSSTIEDDYYDDDDYDEEYDDEEYDDFDEDEKPKNKKKNTKRKILVSIGIIVALLILGSIGFFLAGGTGSSDIVVPNIVGKTVEDAKKDVESLGITIEVSKTDKSDKPENTILESDPKPGVKVKKGTVIKVVVSAGEEQVDMPDLRDFDLNYIKTILASKGLKEPEVAYENSDTVEKGKLIRQSPNAWEKVSKKTDIKVTISEGPEFIEVDVPNVEDETLEKATSILEEAKLKIGEVKYEITSNQDLDQKVLRQYPNSGKLKEGSEVKLTVWQFKEEPIDVTKHLSKGMSVKDARKKLNDLGLSINFTDGSSSDDDAIVTDFTAEAKKGGSVTLTTEKKQNNNGNNGNNNGNNNQ
ncbi:MAG: Stk1 family PASTA domain-containing Ser/Thr kinase [Clostridium sp.]|uniref:Stk1 family PASTA domain-containing Ser/Thr kinase n=1 Tax=Clostridium sp. TaxID=1506 RepID=UPI0029060C4E|nr:Stk1 family PASTA domain-containing Ser/Thr kinase [Clostridium sp.]MDU5109416.1 Stk1 family PASTA domain-containing Ser/Thr kinase [Clostridium sp.]